MPTIQSLTKVAAIMGFITASTGYFLRHTYYKRARKTKAYQKALEIVRCHGKTIEQLGEPITEGKLEFGRSINNLRTFSVVLKGSKTGGKLNCEILLKEPKNQPEISKLEIKFNNMPHKTFVIHEAA